MSFTKLNRWLDRNFRVYPTTTGARRKNHGPEVEVLEPRLAPAIDWFPFGGHEYARTDVPMTFDQAEAYAVSQGGHLVSITSVAEQAFITTTFGNPAWGRDSTSLWIGLTDRFTEGNFRWTSGEATTYTNWFPGEPNSYGGNEDYAVINYVSPGQWVDVQPGVTTTPMLFSVIEREATGLHLSANYLNITQGGSVWLNSTNLSAVNPDDPGAALTFTVSDVTHGYFRNGVPVFSFTLAELEAGFVNFVHDGSEVAPAYKVKVSDGVTETAPAAAFVTFHARFQIAFNSDRDGYSNEIYVMNPDGTNQTRLTNNPAEDWDPAISPDGTKIVWNRYQDNNWEIYLMNADGSGQARLTNNASEDSLPVFSPDGSKIAFNSYRDGNFEIYVMNVDGTIPVRLTNTSAHESNPAWSPDGSKIVFEVHSGSDWDLYVIDIDGSNRMRLTSTPGYDAWPAWSPYGNKIAFASNRDGNERVYVMNADGSDQHYLTNNPGYRDVVPSWSPDGTRIVFDTEREGNIDIYVMNADGSNQTRLTTTSALDARPFWGGDVNVAPLANAGGTYVVHTGSDLVLNGTGSSDPNMPLGDSITAYRWDVDNDGTTDFSGATVTVPWAWLVSHGLNVGTHTVRLEVTDTRGAIGTATAELREAIAPSVVGTTPSLTGGTLPAGTTSLQVTFSEQTASTLGSVQNPAVSALALKTALPSSPSGIYWFDTDGAGPKAPFQAYADMVTDGGGWMLVVNSVLGNEAPTTDMVANIGIVGLSTGHTRDLADLAIAQPAEIRHVINASNLGLGIFDGKYTGRYHDPLGAAGEWTFLSGHSGSTILDYHYGTPWSTADHDQDEWSGNCAVAYGTPWYYRACFSVIPAMTVNGLSQGPVNGTGQPLAQYSIWVRELSTPGGSDSANYELQSLGSDALLGTADDVVVPLTVGSSGNTATLNFSALPEGVYRLTVKDTVTDLVGNPLDGDGDGTAGGNWTQDFVVGPLTYTMTTPNGYTFDPEFGGWGAGELVQGSNNTFDGLNRLQVGGTDYNPPFSNVPGVTVSQASGTTQGWVSLPNWQTVSNLNLAFSGDGSPVRLESSITAAANAPYTWVTFRFVVDGVARDPIAARYFSTANDFDQFNLSDFVTGLTPGNHVVWLQAIGTGGQLYFGNYANVFMTPTISAYQFRDIPSPMFEDAGQTIVTQDQTLVGLEVTREITVPNTGGQDFARTIDAFYNPTDSPITTTARIIGNLGSDGRTRIFTSDGDAIPETTDVWIGTDDQDPNGGMPSIIHYLHTPAGLAPIDVQAGTGDLHDNIEWTYNLTVGPHETVRLAHYTILAATEQAARDAADALVTADGFGGEAAAFLTSTELASLANFQFNRPPVANGQSVTVVEDTPTDLTLTASDPDGDSLTYEVVNPPVHGILSGTGANRTYTPAENWFGTDSFSYRVHDDSGEYSTVATVSITVQSVDDVPVAVPDEYTVLEDAILTVAAPGVLGNDSDADNNPLEATLVSDVSHGSLTLNPDGSFTYAPLSNYNGSDVFTYQVAEKEVRWTSPNASTNGYFGWNSAIDGEWAVVGAPGEIVNGQSYAGQVHLYRKTSSGWMLAKTLTASDAEAGDAFGTSVAIDGDTIVVGTPSGDGASLNNTGAVYLFHRNEGGIDNWGQTAKLNASDAADNAQFGTAVAIDGNTLVVGSNFAYYYEGAAYVFTRDPLTSQWSQLKRLRTSDTMINMCLGTSVAISGDIIAVGAPLYGGYRYQGRVFLFEKDMGGSNNWGEVKNFASPTSPYYAYFGDSLALQGDTLVVGTDGSGDNAAYLYYLNQGGSENWGLAKTLTPSDAGGRFGSSVALDGDIILVGAVANSHDGVSNAGAVYAFERNNGGADNWGPIRKLTASDPQNNAYVGYSVAVSGYDALFSSLYVDNGGYTDAGAAYLRNLRTATTSVTINVTPVNDRPMANPQSVLTAEDTAVSITLTASDIDHDSLMFELVDYPTHGILSGTAPNLMYTPTENYHGVDSFTIDVWDGSVWSELATVSITVSPTNDAPTANAGGPYTIVEGQDLVLNGSGSDIDSGDGIVSYAWDLDNDGVFDDATGATPTIAWNTLKSLGLGDNGATPYSIALRVTDTQGATGTATTTLTVLNTAPTILLSGESTVNEGASYTLTLGNVTDPGADSVTAYRIHWGDSESSEWISGHPSGVVLTHIYADGLSHPTITVDLRDEEGDFLAAGSKEVMVVNVKPTVSVTGPTSSSEGDSVTFSGSFTDPGADQDVDYTYTWSVVASNGQSIAEKTGPLSSYSPGGTVVPDFTFTPYDNGIYTVSLTVMDNDSGSTTAVAADLVVDNEAPTVVVPNGDINEGETFAGIGSFSDPGLNDGPWTATVDYGDLSGEQLLILNPDKSYNLSHLYADNGNYTVTVKVTDKNGATGTGTGTVAVLNVAPIVDAGLDQTIFEGGTLTLRGTFTDPGNLDGHTVDIGWEDGTSNSSRFTLGPISTLEVGLTFASSTDSAVLTVTSVDLATNAVGYRVEHLYPDDILTNPSLSLNQLGQALQSDPTLSGTPQFAHLVDQLCNGTLQLLSSPGNYYTGSGNPMIFGVDSAVEGYGTTIFETYSAYQVAASSAQLVQTYQSMMLDPDQFLADGFVRDPKVRFLPESDPATDYTFRNEYYAPEYVIAYRTRSQFITLPGNLGYVVASHFLEEIEEVKDLWELKVVTPVGVDGTGNTISQVFTIRDEIVNNEGQHEETKKKINRLLSDEERLAYTNALHSGTVWPDLSVGTVTVTVTDKDGWVGIDKMQITVNNVAPVVHVNPMTPINEGEIATITGTFTDPGLLDTHTVVIHWGGGFTGQPDEGTTTLTTDDLTNLGGGVWSFSAAQQYLDDNPTGTSADAYALRVTVTDKDGGVGEGSGEFSTGIVVDVEPNDSLVTAQNLDSAIWSLNYSADIGDRVVNTSQTIPHVTIEGTGNQTFDYYSFTVTAAGTKGIFDIDYGMYDFDPYLRLFNSNSTILAADDDYSVTAGQGGSVHSFDSYIEYTFNTPGVYVIEVGRCCLPYPVPSGADYQLQVSLTDRVGSTGPVVFVRNVAPTVVNHDLSVSEDGPSATLNVLAGLTDPGVHDTHTAVEGMFTSAMGALVNIATNGTTTYDPGIVFKYLGVDQTATDTFSYTVRDDDTGMTTGMVTVTIIGQNDPPVAVDDHYIGEVVLDFSGGSNIHNYQGYDFGGFNHYEGGYGDGDNTMAYAYTLSNSQTGETDGVIRRVDGGDFTLQNFRARSGWVDHPVTVEGFRDGVKVASQTLALTPAYQTFSFGNEWGQVDEVRFGMPDEAYDYLFLDNVHLSTLNLVTDEDHTLDIEVLPNDYDPDVGDTISVTAHDATSANGATITLNSDGTIHYNPTVSNTLQGLPAGASMEDTFQYTITDSHGATDSATVTVLVKGVNDAPTLTVTLPVVTVFEGDVAVNNGSFFDIDTDDTVTITASVGSITQNLGNAGIWSWTFPTDRLTENQTVTITAVDSSGAMQTVTFQLVVNGVVSEIDLGPRVTIGASLNLEYASPFVTPFLGVPPVVVTASYPALMGNAATGSAARFEMEETASVVGAIFYDGDGSGSMDEAEYGLAGVEVTIEGPVTRTTLTDEEGLFSFTDLPPGDYVIRRGDVTDAMSGVVGRTPKRRELNDPIRQAGFEFPSGGLKGTEKRLPLEPGARGRCVFLVPSVVAPVVPAGPVVVPPVDIVPNDSTVPNPDLIRPPSGTDNDLSGVSTREDWDRCFVSMADNTDNVDRVAWLTALALVGVGSAALVPTKKLGLWLRPTIIERRRQARYALPLPRHLHLHHRGVADDWPIDVVEQSMNGAGALGTVAEARAVFTGEAVVLDGEGTTPRQAIVSHVEMAEDGRLHIGLRWIYPEIVTAEGRMSAE